MILIEVNRECCLFRREENYLLDCVFAYYKDQRIVKEFKSDVYFD